MTRRWPVGLLCVALAAVVLGACSGEDEEAQGPRVVQPGAPGEPTRELSAEDLEDLDVQPPAHGPADVTFMQDMILHHAQALEMTAMVPERSTSEDLALLSERMEISQRDEIAFMTAWIEARGEAAPDPEHAHHGHAEPMPGMLTEEELAELRAASGREFDRLFLVFMQHHHEGALVMVAELFAAGGGAEPEIFRFANHVDADQRIEIARMAEMLADLEAGG